MVMGDTDVGRARGNPRLAVLRRQVPFAVVVLVTALGAITLAPTGFRDAYLVSAVVITLTATLLAAVVPWRRLPRWTPATIPLLDMLAVVHAELGGFRAGPLLILPVLTLATAGITGLTVAIAAGTVASWTPTLLADTPVALTAETIPDLVLLPTVVVAAAVSLHVSERRSAAQRHLLTGQSELVEELLTDTRADRRLLEAVLDTIDTEVVVLDDAGRIRTANRSAVRAHGGRFVPGTAVTDLAAPLFAADGSTPVPADRTPLVRAARGDRIDREVVWSGTTRVGRKAYRVSAAPLHGRAGDSTGAVLALDDLTSELEALAKREEFVSAVSHELRTPLTSVTGYLDLVMDDPSLDDDVRRHLEVAVRNAGRLEILIANLLAAARDGAAPQTTAVDLAAVVRDVVEGQTPRADDAHVTVRVRAPRTCTVSGDRTRLTQVVDNLVSNAIKYSTDGGEVAITLTIDDDAPSAGGTTAGGATAGGATAGGTTAGGATSTAERAGTVRLRVRDDGVGIDPADLPHVFDRFYRAAAVRDGTVQGTGLGLSITRRIVEDLGGTITLDSVAGRGTGVDIVLPSGGAA